MLRSHLQTAGVSFDTLASIMAQASQTLTMFPA
jgi:hypothetical protein